MNIKFDIEKEFGFIVTLVALALMITCFSSVISMFYKPKKLFSEDAAKTEVTEVTSDAKT